MHLKNVSDWITSVTLAITLITWTWIIIDNKRGKPAKIWLIIPGLVSPSIGLFTCSLVQLTTTTIGVVVVIAILLKIRRKEVNRPDAIEEED